MGYTEFKTNIIRNHGLGIGKNRCVPARAIVPSPHSFISWNGTFYEVIIRTYDSSCRLVILTSFFFFRVFLFFRCSSSPFFDQSTSRITQRPYVYVWKITIFNWVQPPAKYFIGIYFRGIFILREFKFRKSILIRNYRNFLLILFTPDKQNLKFDIRIFVKSVSQQPKL